ncbi:MAG: 5'/3'-nucleotidase SurE [Deltaproteobacteria bacterium]|nr:5'/3'-nucleotidase SurE [Deltaproteobacteria bacterium]
MLILVSNDDGVYSPGIRALAKALKQIGEVWIVAPDRERSAASHSLTIHRPLRIQKISPQVYAVDGTPTDSVNLGINVLLKKKPDLVVSGINKGANMADDVHYSGTVSAAVEACLMGVPAIAISQIFGKRFLFNPAARFAVKLAKKVLKEGLPRGMVLNVNVPNVHEKEINGFEWVKLGKRNYGEALIEKLDPRGRPYYWVGGDQSGFVNIPGSDCNAIHENKITITPLQIDMTDHAAIKEFKNWKI